jgi:hypothetical protein
MKIFTKEDRHKSHVSHRRKLVASKPFEQLGYRLRKKIVLEDQDYRCLHCGISEWQGIRITLELDHIDGNRYNDKRENLRCLCPNCHSITDTWKVGSVKKTGKRKCTDKEIVKAFENAGSISGALKELDMNWGSGETVKRVLYQQGLIDSL